MRYARGEAILRVIAMRYAPQLIVSQNVPILLANLFPRSQANVSTSNFPISDEFGEAVRRERFPALWSSPTVPVFETALKWLLSKKGLQCKRIMLKARYSVKMQTLGYGRIAGAISGG